MTEPVSTAAPAAPETAEPAPAVAEPTVGEIAPIAPAESRGPGAAAWLACFAIVPLAALAGASTPQDSPLTHYGVAGVGACVLSVVAILAATFARASHRRSLEWVAIAIASLPWIGLSSWLDLQPPRAVSLWAAPAEGYAAVAHEQLTFGNFAGSTSGVMLASLAVAFAFLVSSRRAPSGAGLSRAWLLGSLAPVAILSVVIAQGAHMLGFVALTIVLSGIALDRMAATLDVSNVRSVGLAFAVALSAGAGVAAAATGAAYHGLWNALHSATSSVDSTVLTSALDSMDLLALVQATPLLAIFPLLALLAALDTRSHGRGWPTVPRVAVVLGATVVLTALWLDGRNTLDVRHRLDHYLRSSGTRTLAHGDGDLQIVPLDHGATADGNFVLVGRLGAVSFDGAPLPGGIRGIGRLEGRPAVLLDARITAQTVLGILDAAQGVGRRGEVDFLGRSTSDSRLVAVPFGPRARAVPHGDVIILFLIVSRDQCVLASTAGERIEMPGCDEADVATRLMERRQAEPNRHDIVVAPERDVDARQLLRVLSVVHEAGFDSTFAMDAALL